MDDALCAQVSTEEFFPEKGESTRFAKTVCRGCPFREQCLQYAVENGITHGVWGGLGPEARRALKRRSAA